MSRKSMQDQRREEIFKALDVCLQEKSFDKTSIKDIAQQAGINHGMLHYYFRSKDDILISYIDYVVSNYLQWLEFWEQDHKNAPMEPQELFMAFLEMCMQEITLDRPLSRIFVEIAEIALYKPQVRQKLNSAYRLWVEVMAKELTNMGLEAEAAVRVGYQIVSQLEGLAMLSVVSDLDNGQLELILSGILRQYRQLITLNCI